MSATVSASPMTLDRQAHPEHALDPQDQLGATEAIDAEIAIEPARQGDVHGASALAMQLAHEVGHERDETALIGP